MTRQDCPVSCSEAVSYSISHHLYCSILQAKQGKITVSCSVSHHLYSLFLQAKQGNSTVSYSVSHHLYSLFLQAKQGNSLFPAVSAISLQLNFADKEGRIYCFLQHQPYLLQQTFTKDGVLNILLVVENEACYDGAKQCR